MAAPTLALASEDQIPALVRRSRRELKDLAKSSATARAIVDDVVEMSVDDTPFREWPEGSAAQFVSELCAVALVTIETDSAALSMDSARQDVLNRLADLLISFVIALPGSYDSSVKERLCRLWVCSRLAGGLEQDPKVFIDSAVTALEPIGLDGLKLVAQVESEVLNHLPKEPPAPIPAPRLALTSEDQIPAVVRKNRREFKEIAKSSATARQIVDDVIEMSVDDTPFREWRAGSASQFVSELCGAALTAVETDSTTSSPDNVRQDSLIRLSDLLISFVAAAPGSFDSSMRGRLCRLWVCSRLAAGLGQDPSVFSDGAVTALEPIGLDHAELVAQVESQVLKRLPPRPAPDGLLGTPTQPKRDAAVAKPEPAQNENLSRDNVGSPDPQESGSEFVPPRGVAVPNGLEGATQESPAPPLRQPEVEVESRPDDGSVPPKQHIGRWQQPFEREGDVLDEFPRIIDFALAQLQFLPSSARSQAGTLENSKQDHAKWVEGGGNSSNTGFLAAAARAAKPIATSLIEANRSADAFRLANVFAEIMKMLIPRGQDRFQPLYEDLILVACGAVSQSRLADPDTSLGTGNASDIDLLRRDLDRVCQIAMSTRYTRDRGFVRCAFDTALEDRVTAEIVAAHFDRRLHNLLDEDAPKVNQYVKINMPVVYRMKLFGRWRQAKQQWVRLLTDRGYGPLMKTMRELGDLIDPEEVGKLSEDIREEIRSAAVNDAPRVVELLAGSAKDLRTYLYAEAQRLLQYRDPPEAHLKDIRARNQFANARKATRTGETRKALSQLQKAWEIEIDSLELLDWVACAEARAGSLQNAEQKFDQLKSTRPQKFNYFTDWNLAVLKYERKNENAAYQLLLPLLEKPQADNDLVVVVLALSLKLDDKARFLQTVPRTMSVRYHPIAITIAYEMKNLQRMEELLAQLLANPGGKWELPPVAERFRDLEELRQKVLNKAIVGNQKEQLIAWLEARIQAVRTWVPNYQALAWVLANQNRDVEGAFRVLQRRLEMAQRFHVRSGDEQDKLKKQRSVDEACEEMLLLCRNAKPPQVDLGRAAYGLAKAANARDGLLESFAEFSAPKPPPPPAPLPHPAPPKGPEPQEIRDPKLMERVAWVNAGVLKIRNVHSYIEKVKEIEEFTKILSEVGPNESTEALSLIRSITAVVETFSKTADDGEARSTLRTLYTRVVGYEKQLAHLLQGDVLTPAITNLIAPYRQALQEVIGDLSRKAGVGPVVDVKVENQFLSLEGGHSTIVLRVTDGSERPVTDINVDSVSEEPTVVRIAGARRRQIPRLEPQASELLSIPTERAGAVVNPAKTEVTFAFGVRASAEGFSAVDMPMKRLTIPIKTLAQATGIDQIPKLFMEKPLNPSVAESTALFQGRAGLLKSIQNSFYGGIQRERYFFDGIRRVGKTTLLQFLPLYVHESCLPVLINVDDEGLAWRFNSAKALQKFCVCICNSAKTERGIELDIPSESAFDADPGSAFKKFLDTFASGLPGRVPLLMIDEFQGLLHEIARTGSEGKRDALVLDQLRGQLDAGRLNALFTGSVRFDSLNPPGTGHKIFGSLKRLSVSFLNEESVRDVLTAGLGQWATVLPETALLVHRLTGGYPWLVQKYGSELVERLNDEHRTVAAPKDVEDITDISILGDNTLFDYWWPADQLKDDEERFIERLFRKYALDQPISTKSFLSDVSYREQSSFRAAFDNLQACEVLDSTQAEFIRFSGGAMRRWLERQLHDGQLVIPKRRSEPAALRGQGGIFIDHENFIRSLEEISVKRGVAVPERGSPTRLRWFKAILKNVMADAERRIGPLSHKVAVAFWSRAHEAEVSPAYQEFDFSLKEPEYTGKGGEGDFKLADEARRAREQAARESSTLSRAVVVTGDGDLSQLVRGLKNDGVSVQVVGGTKNTGNNYIMVVGQENFVALQDVCGL